MSLFNTLQTSVSGMAAQSNALSVISDNIANAQTVGYKEAQAQFETALGGGSGGGNYESGGVKTDIRYGITNQGTASTTTSATDLAIQGNGFFVVSKGTDTQLLTRAGSFVPDTNGNLVNSAGYNLMGYKIGTSGTSSELSVVNISTAGLTAAASTTGILTTNLNSSATTVTGNTPTDNKADSAYTSKTSLTVYDNLGTPDIYDVYLTKITDADNTKTPVVSPQWQVTAYPQSDATNGGFPYTNVNNINAGNPTGADTSTGTATLTFDDTTGKILSGTTASLKLNVPNGNAGGVVIDLSQTTQLAADFGVTTKTANGNSASPLNSVSIGKDGTVNAVYGSGATISTYKIPLAVVESPNNLTALSGNVYQASNTSGNVILSDANTGDVGYIASNSLEQSTVDLATELTNMIAAQRGYEANSKVLQAASALLGNLNQIQTN